jgi:hypothetical protein
VKKLFSDDNYNYGSAMKTAIVAFTLNPASFGSETQGLTGKIKNGGQETQYSCPDPCFEMIIEI